jgi:hypothetical protein
MILLLAGLAHAGSCCLPSTSAFPLALGSCERFGLGVSVAGTERLGAWGWDGRVVLDGTYDQRALELSVAGLYRIVGPLQAALAVPVGVESVRAGDTRDVAFGLGDLSAQLLVLPDGPVLGPLRPSIGADVRVPLPQPAPHGLASPASDAVSIGLGGTVELQHEGGAAALLLGGRYSPAATALSGTVALTEAVRMIEALDATFSLGATVTATTARPEAGVGAVFRASPTIRLTARVDAAPPIPGLGRSADADVRASAALLVAGP